MGVDLDRYDRVVGLRSKVVSGSARLAPGEAIVGRELAQDLGVRVGDRLTVQTGSVSGTGQRFGARDRAGGPGRERPEPAHRDRAAARAQSLLALPGGATQLDLTLKDVWVAQTLARELRGSSPTRSRAGREQCPAGVGAERAVHQHLHHPRRGAGGGGAGHCQRAGGVGGAKGPRDRHPARHGRHAGQVLRVFLVQGAVVGALGSVLGCCWRWR
jgi:lipoprotein-releasing system permease protein